MRSFSYFIVLFLGAIGGKYAMGLITAYLWLAILQSFRAPSSTASIAIAYLLSIPGWLFVLFLLFRIYICIRQKQITIPVRYKDTYYKIGLTVALLFTLAVLITTLSALVIPAGGMSGVPLVMVLLPLCIISIFLTLRFEIPAIHDYIRGAVSEKE